jgi:hypothetical protein
MKMKESERKSVNLIKELQGEVEKRKEEIAAKKNELSVAGNRIIEL